MAPKILQNKATWASQIKSVLSATKVSFYLLSIIFRKVDYIKIGVAQDLGTRDWSITDKRGRRLHYDIIAEFPESVGKLTVDRHHVLHRRTSTIESVVRYLLTQLTGGPVSCILVDGNVSQETFRVSAVQAIGEVHKAMQSMDRFATVYFAYRAGHAHALQLNEGDAVQQALPVVQDTKKKRGANKRRMSLVTRFYPQFHIACLSFVPSQSASSTESVHKSFKKYVIEHIEEGVAVPGSQALGRALKIYLEESAEYSCVRDRNTITAHHLPGLSGSQIQATCYRKKNEAGINIWLQIGVEGQVAMKEESVSEQNVGEVGEEQELCDSRELDFIEDGGTPAEAWSTPVRSPRLALGSVDVASQLVARSTSAETIGYASVTSVASSSKRRRAFGKRSREDLEVQAPCAEIHEAGPNWECFASPILRAEESLDLIVATVPGERTPNWECLSNCALSAGAVPSSIDSVQYADAMRQIQERDAAEDRNSIFSASVRHTCPSLTESRSALTPSYRCATP